MVAKLRYEPAFLGPSNQELPPSRYTNPFSTCWTAPGRIGYVDFESESVDNTLQRLELTNGWGAIVGQHGSGKSTLLHAIEAALAEQGRTVTWVHCSKDSKFQYDDVLKRIGRDDSQRSICFLEGFERLGFFARQRLLWFCYRRRAKVVVTLHEEAILWPWRLPTLVALSANHRQVRKMFDRLLAHEANPLVSWHDALPVLEKVNHNLREFWFELYGLHEERRKCSQRIDTPNQ